MEGGWGAVLCPIWVGLMVIMVVDGGVKRGDLVEVPVAMRVVVVSDMSMDHGEFASDEWRDQCLEAVRFAVQPRRPRCRNASALVAEDALNDRASDAFVEMDVVVAPVLEIEVISISDERFRTSKLLQVLSSSSVDSGEQGNVIVLDEKEVSASLEYFASSFSRENGPGEFEGAFTLIVLNAPVRQKEYCYRFQNAAIKSSSFVGSQREAFVDLFAGACNPIIRWGSASSELPPRVRGAASTTGIIAAWTAKAFESLVAPDMLFCGDDKKITFSPTPKTLTARIDFVVDHDLKDPSKLFDMDKVHKVARIVSPEGYSFEIQFGEVFNLMLPHSHRRSQLSPSAATAVDEAVHSFSDFVPAELWSSFYEQEEFEFDSEGISKVTNRTSKSANASNNGRIIHILILSVARFPPSLLVDKVARYATDDKGGIVLVGSGNPSPFFQDGLPLPENENATLTRHVAAAVSTAVSGLMAPTAGSSGSTAFLAGPHLQGILGDAEELPIFASDTARRFHLLRDIDMTQKRLDRLRHSLESFSGGRNLMLRAIEEVDFAQEEFRLAFKTLLTRTTHALDAAGERPDKGEAMQRVQHFVNDMQTQLSMASTLSRCAPLRIRAPRSRGPSRSKAFLNSLAVSIPILVMSVLLGFLGARQWNKNLRRIKTRSRFKIYTLLEKPRAFKKASMV